MRTWVAAALVPTALSGSVLVERLFAIRGSGGLLAEAVFARDTPTILGLTLFVAAVVVLASVLSDLVAALADPRTLDEGSPLPSSGTSVRARSAT